VFAVFLAGQNDTVDLQPPPNVCRVPPAGARFGCG
jgi:hypothetical protein